MIEGIIIYASSPVTQTVTEVSATTFTTQNPDATSTITLTSDGTSTLMVTSDLTSTQTLTLTSTSTATSTSSSSDVQTENLTTVSTHTTEHTESNTTNSISTVAGPLISIVPGASLNPTSPGFAPDNIVVVIGVNNTVTWINNDDTSQTVSSTAFLGLFNSGNLATNQTFSFTFTNPGTYTYRSSVYYWMNGSITVEA